MGLLWPVGLAGGAAAPTSTRGPRSIRYLAATEAIPPEEAAFVPFAEPKHDHVEISADERAFRLDAGERVVSKSVTKGDDEGLVRNALEIVFGHDPPFRRDDPIENDQRARRRAELAEFTVDRSNVRAIQDDVFECRIWHKDSSKREGRNFPGKVFFFRRTGGFAPRRVREALGYRGACGC